MSTIQAPNDDITVEASGGVTMILVRSRSLLRNILANLALPIGAIGGGIPFVLGVMIAVMSNFGIGFVLILLGLAIFAATIGVQYWASKKNAVQVTKVSSQGIEKNGKMYLFSDIHNLTHGFVELEAVTNDTGMKAVSQIQASEDQNISGRVGFQFGGEIVDLFTALERGQVTRVYIALAEACSEHGYTAHE